MHHCLKQLLLVRPVVFLKTGLKIFGNLRCCIVALLIENDCRLLVRMPQKGTGFEIPVEMGIPALRLPQLTLFHFL